jgi:hypothetical protein
MTAKTYVSGIPKSIPKGRILVHNSMRPEGSRPGTVPGASGFRAWLDKPDIFHIRCECGWAPRGGAHYRMKGVGWIGRSDDVGDGA